MRKLGESGAVLADGGYLAHYYLQQAAEIYFGPGVQLILGSGE